MLENHSLRSRNQASARKIAIVALVMVVAGVAGVSLAVQVPVAGTYDTAKILTKADLDANFTAIEARLQALEGTNNAPVGTVVAYAGAIDGNPNPDLTVPRPMNPPPLGWLYCNGDAVSRVTYVALSHAIGIAHGGGDGTTTFNLPDYRGRFLRGVDDAQVGRDHGARSKPRDGDSMVTGGPGNLSGVGSIEGAATALPTAPFTTSVTGSHAHTIGMAVDGAFTAGNLDFPTGGGSTYHLTTGPYGIGGTAAAGDHMHTVSGGGDVETRPINSAVNYIIKF